ncbi:hypothetical protein OF117_02455 [Geodermatophilus sp. YIM 151500]|uniref:hypothetical protein n=1 Tax=Geodermatophilus sp. YIM 151500 TaxID=2984531 RepID=UPI0021E46E8F|nr:hypothetical protein [Geodermatophilus sp. YIM 151500]MCV2488214.1 hypothetical protein [Geodermatophilus sp. YIM 151500]
MPSPAGLLLVNARRRPRTSSGLPRVAAALRSWLETNANREAADWAEPGLVEWL